MPAFEISTLVVLAALGLGVVFGVLAERSQFCLLSGVRDRIAGRSDEKLLAFVLAALMAVAGTQALVSFGALDLSGAIYLPKGSSLVAAALGGALFGLGAVAARGCLGRLIVLSSTGNLRAAVVILTAGVIAYATLRGVLAIPRTAMQAVLPTDAAAVDLAVRMADATGIDASFARLAVVALAVGLAALVLLRHGPTWRLVAGAAIGLLVVAGWAVTGILGADEFEPTPVASLTFAAPLGNSLQYLMTATGARVDFGIALVGGTLLGAALSARLAGAAKLQGFEGAEQMLRYLSGAALMGFGAVLALGCTAGQGLTGVSTLSILSFVALAAIVAGMRLGFVIEARLTARGEERTPAGDPKARASGSSTLSPAVN